MTGNASHQDKARNLYAPAMRYFAKVAEVGSIRAASRELNVASSAVNRQVLWLEEALGLQLFERVGRRLKLSEAGEVLLAHVRRTYSDFDGTMFELEALKGLRRGTVTIATVESVSEVLLPRLISSFRKTFPDINLKVIVATSNGAAKRVETGEADVGFTFDPPEAASLSVAFHHDLAIGALMRPDHELAHKKVLTLSECLKYPIALPSEGLSLRARLDAARRGVEQDPDIVAEANSLKFLRSMVRSGPVVGFQTRVGAEDDLASGQLVFRPLKDGPLQADRLCIVTSSMRALGLAPARFFEHAVETLKVHLELFDANTAS